MEKLYFWKNKFLESVECACRVVKIYFINSVVFLLGSLKTTETNMLLLWSCKISMDRFLMLLLLLFKSFRIFNLS